MEDEGPSSQRELPHNEGVYPYPQLSTVTVYLPSLLNEACTSADMIKIQL